MSFLELFPELGELKNATRAGCHMRFLALLMVSLEIFVNKKASGSVFILHFFFLLNFGWAEPLKLSSKHELQNSSQI